MQSRYSTAIAFLVCILVSGLVLIGCQPAAPSDPVADLETIQPGWLFPADACPADVMPAEPALWTGEDRCATSLQDCLSLCELEDARACQDAAYAVQDLDNEVVSEALFLRACALGIVPGCTNRAAGMLTYDGETDCSARTFERTCASDEPWGCAMYGMSLASGRGTEQTFAEARVALERACEIDAEFEACRSAREIMNAIPQEEP